MQHGQIQNVVKTIDGETLFEIDNLTIPTAGVVAMVGENGAGKTTLLNMLQGIDTDYTYNPYQYPATCLVTWSYQHRFHQPSQQRLRSELLDYQSQTAFHHQ